MLSGRRFTNMLLLYLKQMREAVRDAASLFPTAIVSGRCREKVRCIPVTTLPLERDRFPPVLSDNTFLTSGLELREAIGVVLRWESRHGHKRSQRRPQAHKSQGGSSLLSEQLPLSFSL